MQRRIAGFHQDESSDWVAELSCGHGQHVRHKPPFWSRPWVITAEGRAAMVGGELECVLCDRFELPAGHAAYKRTPIFHRGSIPDGLRKNHATKPGVWGVIHVVSGLLRYVIQPPLAGEHDLDPLRPGIVVPEVLHHVSPTGDVELYVEFFRATGRRDDSVAG